MTNDEEQDRVTVKLTRAILGNTVFDPENASALMIMVAHNITSRDVEEQIDEILTYLEQTKELKEAEEFDPR